MPWILIVANNSQSMRSGFISRFLWNLLFSLMQGFRGEIINSEPIDAGDLYFTFSLLSVRSIQCIVACIDSGAIFSSYVKNLINDHGG